MGSKGPKARRSQAVTMKNLDPLGLHDLGPWVYFERRYQSATEIFAKLFSGNDANRK